MTQPCRVIDGPLWACLWPGGPRNLVLLHGFLSDGRAWEPLLPALLPRYSVLCVDLPGHGQSASRFAPMGEDPWQWQTHALVQVVGRAFAQPPVLAGYSMGGRVAAHAATSTPGTWSGLLLESAHPGLAEPAERDGRAAADAARAAAVLRDGVRQFAHDWQLLPLFASQQGLPVATLDRQQQLRMAQRADGIATSLLQYGTGVMPPVSAGPWPARVVVLAGALDPAYSAALPTWNMLCPEATCHRVCDAGHNIHLEQPGHWLDALRSL